MKSPDNRINSCKLQALLIFGCVCVANGAFGSGLVWEHSLIRIAAPPGVRVVTVEFSFRNAGKTAIAIVSTETSCRCVAADAPTKSFKPGERGHIEVALTVGDQVGNVEKTINVSTNEAQEAPFRLTLQVHIVGRADG